MFFYFHFDLSTVFVSVSLLDFLVVALGIPLYICNLSQSIGISILPAQVKYRKLSCPFNFPYYDYLNYFLNVENHTKEYYNFFFNCHTQFRKCKRKNYGDMDCFSPYFALFVIPSYFCFRIILSYSLVLHNFC
jgi:hypothetical protein